MRDNAKFIAFTLFVAACLIGTIWYGRSRLDSAASQNTTSTAFAPIDVTTLAAIGTLRAEPHLVFQSSRANTLGRLSMVPLATPDSASMSTTIECERSHFGPDAGLCLTINRESMQPRGFGYLLDARFQVTTRFPLVGMPIRARISPDQRYAAATVFVTGESYAGDFTTRTTIIDLASRTAIADLEQFKVERDGQPFHKVDFNFWGVTFFRDGNVFFATLGTEGQRLLVKGDIAQRRLQVIDTDVECPSLSPDERHIVFKRQQRTGSGWQLWAMDVQTRDRWAITEDGQDVDDQVEWLDDAHVVYGRIAGSGVPEVSLSLWTSDVRRDAGRNQQLYLRSASSPSVVRASRAK